MPGSEADVRKQARQRPAHCHCCAARTLATQGKIGPEAPEAPASSQALRQDWCMIVTALTTHFTTLVLGALSTNLVILMHVGRTAATRKPMMTRVHISPPSRRRRLTRYNILEAVGVASFCRATWPQKQPPSKLSMVCLSCLRWTERSYSE